MGSKAAGRRAAIRAAEKTLVERALAPGKKAKRRQPKAARKAPGTPDVIKGLVSLPTQGTLPAGRRKLGGRSTQQDSRPVLTIFNNTLGKAKVLRDRGDRAVLSNYLAGTDREFARQIPDSAKLRAKALELQALAKWAGLDYRLVQLLERKRRG